MVTLRLSEFFPKKSADGDIGVNISHSGCPANPDCGKSKSLLFGYHKEADMEVKGKPDLWNIAGGPQAVIRHLIGLEIAAQPDEVGPPIAIAQIDSTGVHWIDKGACQQ
jgi:hypothetical protein